MDTWASSVAMGWPVRYVQVVVAPRVTRPVGRPLATAVSSLGAVMRKVKYALSDGWSLDGKTRWAASAWLAMASPSLVRTQPPVSAGPLGSLVCLTVISIDSPSSIGTAGVTTRSSPLVANVAARPSTLTAETVPWVKSRLSRSRSSVASASIRVTAASGWVLTPG